MNEKAKTIFRILKNTYKIDPNDFAVMSTFKENVDVFKVLVITILTQNSTDKAAYRAYQKLANMISITPNNIINLDIKKLKDAIREAGLYNTKADALKRLSKIILEKYNGSLDFLLSMDLNEARKILTSLPKVGPKTADVVLLMLGRKPTIPIDTHINRVSKRLGLVPQKSNYDEIRLTLVKLYDPSEYLDVHLLLIQHGRKICKAIHPKCLECPINRLCDYYNSINR
ncbi:MAG: endonuclease III domain-containing protein [Thermoprotei archaeon]